jgi:hypothetical protein
MNRHRWIVAFAVVATLVSGSARADILVMRSPSGETFISNRGTRPGYAVVKRIRELPGSSGMGLRSLKGGDSSRFDPLIRDTALAADLDPSLVKAVIRAESNFHPGATSPKGAMGLMQLMPATAKWHGIDDAYDPSENVRGGVRHLRFLVDRYGEDWDLVLAAYNAGTKPVDKVRGIPNYPETQFYVRRVREFHRYYAEHGDFGRPSRASELAAALDLDRATPEELYHRPIVFRGPGAVKLPAPRKAAAKPAGSEGAGLEKLLGDEHGALGGAHLRVVRDQHELDPVLECRLEPQPAYRGRHAAFRVAV